MSSESPGTSKTDWLIVIAFATIVLGLLYVIGPTGDTLLELFTKKKQLHPKAVETQLCAALTQFEIEYGAMPTGDNAQIVAALRGKNPRSITFLETAPRFLNAAGVVIDTWKMPYRIDASTPAQPRVYSFGPDKQDNGGAAGSDDIVSWQ